MTVPKLICGIVSSRQTERHLMTGILLVNHIVNAWHSGVARGRSDWLPGWGFRSRPGASSTLGNSWTGYPRLSATSGHSQSETSAGLAMTGLQWSAVVMQCTMHQRPRTLSTIGIEERTNACQDAVTHSFSTLNDHSPRATSAEGDYTRGSTNELLLVSQQSFSAPISGVEMVP
jgi:hypothetical protein